MKSKKQKETVPSINNTIEADLNLLYSLLSVRTYSKSSVQDEFINWLETLFSNDTNTVTEKDNYGNLYVTKGQADLYPCVIAHTDINQEERDKVEIITSGDWIHGFDLIRGETAGIGADDKCGIGLAIEMFNRFDTIKLFFPKDEEVGLIGTHKSNKSFFSNCTMLLQGDRRSYTTDLITYTNGRETCSQEFVDTITPIMEKYGYSGNKGVSTDIGGLKSYDEVDCIACNISIGYFNEHSDNEVISISRYNNAINFVYEILKTHGKTKFFHKSPKESYNSNYSTYYRSSNYDIFSNGSTKSNNSVNNQGDLFDDLYDYDLEFYPLQTESKFTEIPESRITDKDLDTYYKGVYGEYKNVENRKNLIHLVYDYETCEVALELGLDQVEVDDILTQGCCPICGNEIEISTSLMIAESCYNCSSTFNLTVEDYEGYFKNQDNTNSTNTTNTKNIN